MPRELSDIEKKYIEENYLSESAKSIAGKIKGIGEITVQAYIDELPPPVNSEESAQERQRRLQMTKVSGSRLMGRDKDRGITVMTEAASELIDARRTVALPKPSKEMKKKHSDKIHRPFQESDYDR